MAKQRFSIPCRLLGAGFLALVCGLATAQTYRWVDPATGRVMYTDTPPPGNAKQVSRTGRSAAPEGEKELPYATRLAAQNFPVTLYTTSDCDPCNKARELLKKRNVPFTEKSVQDEAHLKELKTLAGDDPSLPYLKVGRQLIKGFEPSAYDSNLDLAGYPKASGSSGATP